MARPGQQKNRRKRALAEMEAASSTSTPTSYYAESSTAGTNLPDQLSPYNIGASYGQAEENNDDDDQDGGQVMDNPRSQCLPVGILPIDFDGTPLDGSQFLAMANRDNQNLPFVKSVDNPYQTEIPLSSKHLGLNMTDNNGASSSGSSTRHPALPKESWQVLFPIHFQGYRKHIQSQLSSSSNPLSYPENYPPIPNLNRRSEWYAFVNGYILDDKSKTKTKKGKEKEKAKPILTEEEMMNASIEESMDVEEQESKDAEVVEKVIIGKTSNGNEKRIGAVREPLLSLLKGITSSQALKILSHFAHWISESIEQSPPLIIPNSPDLLPTQPDQEPSSPSFAKHKEKEVRSVNPLSSNYFNWIFGLLLIVDERLLGEEISILRELARSAMRVAGHRWILGVVGKDIDENWILGGEWKLERNEKEYQNQIGPQIPAINDTTEQNEETKTSGTEGKANHDDATVDDILARCWLIVHAVAAGWGQKDLLMELETLFT